MLSAFEQRMTDLEAQVTRMGEQIRALEDKVEAAGPAALRELRKEIDTEQTSRRMMRGTAMSAEEVLDMLDRRIGSRV